MDRRSPYLSYLLRLWQTSSRGDPRWLASLESPGTGERRGFTSLQELFAFLEARMRESERRLGAPPSPESEVDTLPTSPPPSTPQKRGKRPGRRDKE